MTASTRQSAFQPQLSAIVRFGAAVAIAIVLALVWVGAEHESHQAVQTAAAAFSHVAPAKVQVAGLGT